MKNTPSVGTRRRRAGATVRPDGPAGDHCPHHHPGRGQVHRRDHRAGLPRAGHHGHPAPDPPAARAARLPGWAASLVMLLGAYLLLFLLALALIVSVAQLAALLPEYTEQINDEIEQRGQHLAPPRGRAGPDRRRGRCDRPGAARRPRHVGAVRHPRESSATCFFLVTVLLFMAFDTDSTRRSLATLGERFPNPVAALANFARGHSQLHGRLGGVRTRRRGHRRRRPVPHGRAGGVRVGCARFRHQLHPQHRLRHRRDPTRA